MKTKLTRKRLEFLMKKRSIVQEILGNYAGSFALGIAKYAEEEGGPALLLLIENEKDRKFPRAVRRYGEEIKVLVKKRFNPPRPLRKVGIVIPVNLNKLAEELCRGA